jgi:glycosyltransferase involved in cell wall biosynthesis
MKPKNKIALANIVKDDTEAEMLERCLNSVAPYVDGLFLNITQEPNEKIKKIAQKYGANYEVHAGEYNHKVTKKEVDWLEKFFGYKPNLEVGQELFQFSKARNANMKMIPEEYGWMFWIDTDDTLLNGDLLKDSALKAEQQDAEAVFYNYLYEVELDEKGNVKNVIIQHLRERLVRINGEYDGVYKWIGNIHETLIQQRETKKIEDSRIEIVHLSTRDRFTEALKRNVSVLEHEIYETKGKDPRPVYYLGKAYFDFHKPEEHDRAEKLITKYLSPDEHDAEMSGWTQERSQAWEYLGEIYSERGQHNKAIQAFHNALIEYPQFPSTYFALATVYMIKEDFDTARFWAIMGSKVPPAKTTLVSNPRDLEARAYEVIYNVGLKTNRIDEAHEACKRLTELFPEDPRIKEQWNFINETQEIRDQLKNYAGLVSYLNSTGQQGKLRALIAATPQQLSDNPYVVKLTQDLYPPKSWASNEIALYCGEQFTAWDPSVLEGSGNSFIGGSEEAVIYLTSELKKLGWKVVVYGAPTNEGVYDGVEYLNSFKFNPKDKFNVVIWWRAIGYSDLDVDAKQQYLWSHDVQSQVEYTDERLDRLNKVIVLSKAHRENLPKIDDKKFLISSNGYVEHHPEIKPKNDPKRAIWTSSYDRGLEHLLEIWPDVLKEVPDAKLEIFYGWKLFKHFYKDNPERMAWLKKVEEMMGQKGITHHGRVPQPEVEKWHKKCGIWAYPTHFYEINCISAIKAQLWGCVPVCTNYAALNETVKYGTKIDGDIWDKEVKEKYTKELIKAFKDEKWQDEQRKLMMPWARKKYHWSKIAKQWDKEFGGVKNG